tara:strand:- start:38824 stop:39186 length:363 start_codon:yes stop_codon:yes gene_type:complete
MNEEQNPNEMKHLWSMFCGEENEQEEHYYADTDNQRLYYELTDMESGERIEFTEVTDTHTIVFVYEVYLNDKIGLTRDEVYYLDLKVEQDLDDSPEDVELSVNMLSNIKKKLKEVIEYYS